MQGNKNPIKACSILNLSFMIYIRAANYEQLHYGGSSNAAIFHFLKSGFRWHNVVMSMFDWKISTSAPINRTDEWFNKL